MADLEPLLVRQLKKAGLRDPAAVPDAEVWPDLLRRISDHYRHMKEDRDMLVRSLELSTVEMESSASQAKGERSSLSELIGSLAEAIGALASMTDSQVDSDHQAASLTSRLDGTQTSFLARLDAAAASLGTPTPEVALVRKHFLSLADVLRRSIGERASHQSLRRELEVASSVQQLLLPVQPEFERPFVSVAAYSMPAAACSGDWWTVHDLPDGRVLTAIGDVTGHGVPAAIITGAAKAACDVARSMYGDKLTPANLLKVMNRGIEGAGGQRLLMTCVAAIFDPHERSLTLANAGHTLPYLVRMEEDRVQTALVRAHGTPLGTTREATYTTTKVPLADGDYIFLHTDGLVEHENAQSEPFGHKRLRLALEQGHGFAPKGLRDVVLHQLTRHAGDYPAEDDVSFIACRFGE